MFIDTVSRVETKEGFQIIFKSLYNFLPSVAKYPWFLSDLQKRLHSNMLQSLNVNNRRR